MIQKCLKKAGFDTTQEHDILTSWEGIDFESLVAMDDEVATCNVPDPMKFSRCY